MLLKGADSIAWFCIQVMIMLMIHQPFSSLSCAQVVTVLQLTWEFVEIEQHLLFFFTWELESLGPIKDLLVQVPNQTYCL